MVNIVFKLENGIIICNLAGQLIVRSDGVGRVCHSAGYDLKSSYNYEISPFNKYLLRMDLSIDLLEGCSGRIAPQAPRYADVQCSFF